MLELNESNLDGSELSIELTDDMFIDNSIDINNITLVNNPIGMTAGNITYNNETSASLVISYDGTDIIGDITNFQIIVDAQELHGVDNLTSNLLTIHEGVGIDDDKNWDIKIYGEHENVIINIAEMIKSWEYAKIVIYDGVGKVILSDELQKTKVNTFKLNVYTGNYFVKVNIDGTVFVNKLFIIPK
jgi:hypothetical protein